jgi:hypothetical protein
MSGAFCFFAFAGKAFAIKAGFLNQVERVGGKPEFVLRDVQAASVSSHDRFSIQTGFMSAAK